MSLMIVPREGDRVVVASNAKMLVGDTTHDVFVGEVGEVLGVTAAVVGEGRYVKVKFTENVIGYIHESNLNKV